MNRKQELILLQVSILAVRADGTITDNEKKYLTRLIEEYKPTQEQYEEIDQCWIGKMDISAIAEKAIQENIEKETFKRAAEVLLHDGLNQREHEFIRELAEYLNLDDKTCQKLFLEVTEEMNFDFLEETNEKEKEKKDTDSLILNYAISGAGIGLTPIPFISDFIVLTPLQMKMVYEIGKIYGYNLDKQSIKEFIALLGVAFGLKVVGSIIKMIPVVGSLGGAAVAFSGTYAMGKTADLYFKRGRTIDDKELQQLYKEFKKEGEELYQKVKDRIKR